MNKLRVAVILGVFCAGYVVADLMNNLNISSVSEARAHANMASYNIYDFKSAVRRVIEDCSISGSQILC